MSGGSAPSLSEEAGGLIDGSFIGSGSSLAILQTCSDFCLHCSNDKTAWVFTNKLILNS